MLTLQQFSIQDYTKPLLSKPQLKLVPAHFQNDEWFISEYQARAHKQNPECYTLRTLLEAVKNSEEQFQQYPVDDRRAKEIARSIFIEDQWLMRDIALAFYQNRPYIVGGRHRVTAIANVFAAIIKENYKETEQDEMFELALSQFVRCEVIYLQTMHDLLALVRADNQSRVMRKAEQAHLDLQVLGADSHSIDAVGKTVLTSELGARDAVSLAAQHFVRQTDSKLKAQTRQVLGEKIARYVLYGTLDGKLYKHTPLKVESTQAFSEKMDRAWEIVKELTNNEIVVAKYSTDIAQKVMDRLHVENGGSVEPLILTEEAKQDQLETQEPECDQPKTSRRGRKKQTESDPN